MNLSQFNRILLQVFLLPVIALLLMAGALYYQIGSANMTVNRIQEADAFIAQTTLVGKLTIDEESGLRGYETTSDTRFLQPFVDAEARLRTEFQRLEQMAVDADQKRLISDLRSKHQTWRDAFALPIIATVRAGGQTSDVDLNLQGKSLMDDVRADIVVDHPKRRKASVGADRAVASAGATHAGSAASSGSGDGCSYRAVYAEPSARCLERL